MRPETVACFRCIGVELARRSESTAALDFLECPSCRRQFARRDGGQLTYRWPHPLSLALYGVIFDEDPAGRAASQADAIVESRSPDELRGIVEEIELELNEPTHRVREALGNRATEAKCREYLRAFVARIRARLRAGSPS